MLVLKTSFVHFVSVPLVSGCSVTSTYQKATPTSSTISHKVWDGLVKPTYRFEDLVVRRSSDLKQLPIYGYLFRRLGEHLLQHCRLHDAMRRDTWPEPTLLRDMLYGDLEELRRTAAFVRATGIPI